MVFIFCKCARKEKKFGVEVYKCNWLMAANVSTPLPCWKLASRRLHSQGLHRNVFWLSLLSSADPGGAGSAIDWEFKNYQWLIIWRKRCNWCTGCCTLCVCILDWVWIEPKISWHKVPKENAKWLEFGGFNLFFLHKSQQKIYWAKNT